MQNNTKYEISQNGCIYHLTSDIVSDNIKLFCRYITQPNDSFSGFFSLSKLRQINPIFLKCKNIFEAQRLINGLLEKNQIRIINYGKYLDLLISITNGYSKINLRFFPLKNIIESIPCFNNNLNSPKNFKKRENLTFKLSPKNNFISGNTSPIINRNNNLLNYQTSDNTNFSSSSSPSNNEEILINNYENEKFKSQSNNPQFNFPQQNEFLLTKINMIENENKNLKTQINQLNNKLNEYNSNNQNYFSNSQNIIENISKNIVNLKVINEKLISENEFLKNQLNQINNQIIINDDSNDEYIKGEILKSYEELEFLSSKIGENYNKTIFNIIYKASVNSDKAEAFHEKCDNAQNTLVLIETDENKRFGGFTTCNWSGNQVHKNDENAFIFSLDTHKIYDIIPGQPAIGCYPNYGPIFLGCQIKINDDAFTQGGTTYLKGKNYQTEEDYELNGGNQKFNIKEIEVYEIELK